MSSTYTSLGLNQIWSKNDTRPICASYPHILLLFVKTLVPLLFICLVRGESLTKVVRMKDKTHPGRSLVFCSELLTLNKGWASQQDTPPQPGLWVSSPWHGQGSGLHWAAQSSSELKGRATPKPEQFPLGGHCLFEGSYWMPNYRPRFFGLSAPEFSLTPPYFLELQTTVL